MKHLLIILALTLGACTANYLPSCKQDCKQGSDKAFDLDKSGN